MSEWKEYKLGEICYQITDGKHGDCENETNSGFYFLSAKDIKDGRLVYENARQIKRTDFEETHKRTNLQPGDILITNSGTIGRMAIAPKDDKTKRTTFQKSVAIIKPINNKIDYRFCFYKLLADFSKLVDLAGGTTQQNLLLGDLREHMIKFPPLPEQKAIAGVLSSLDDKIDLLQRQNKTREGMAEAIWRKMFVEEADPGWKKGRLGDIAEINPLRTLKKGTIATYIDMSNMPTSGPFPKEWIKREFTNGMKFKNGDTIIARITPCLENGKTAYINFLNDSEIGWGSTEYVILAPKSGYCPEWFYFLARYDDFRDFAIQNMTGTSGRQRVSGVSISHYEIKIPPIQSLEPFCAFTSSVMEYVKYNSLQIRTLVHLRDTLLPKLMSGEVRVRL